VQKEVLMLTRISLSLFAITLLPAFALSAEKVPVAVSPGSGGGVHLVADSCTTFSWAGTTNARGLTIAVFQVTPDGQLGSSIISQPLPAGASTWTVPAGRCLARGMTYAWTVGARSSGHGESWSDPVFFTVTLGPTDAECREALVLLRSYMSQRSGVSDLEAPGGGAATIEPGRPRSLEGSRRTATVQTYLSVDGNVDAVSFSGDGSQLTDVTAVEVSGSFAGDVTGTQAATTVAAIQKTPVSSTTPTDGQIVRYTAISSEWEPGAVILSNPAAVSGILPLTSGGTGAPDASGALGNIGAAAAEHLHTESQISDLSHTIDTVLTEGQVEAYVTNGPLDGTSFTNVTAATGDSATAFFATGRIEEPRIADEIARDTEIVAAFDRLWGRGRTGTVVYGEEGTEPPSLCTDGSVNFGLSNMTVDWGSAADACPAGTWVCTLSERGTSVCDTVRPDVEEQRNCGGELSDLSPEDHRGWVDDLVVSTQPEARYLSEQGSSGGVLSCVTLPVWCCSNPVPE
jgi:hypothetical protein